MGATELLDEIEEYCGEGLIALPEVRESAERLGLDAGAAVRGARVALGLLLDTGRLRIYEGGLVTDPPPEVDVHRAKELIGLDESYFYGPLDNDRAYFILDCA